MRAREGRYAHRDTPWWSCTWRGRVRNSGVWTMEEELDPSLSEGIEAHHVFHRQPPVRGAAYALYLWSAMGAYRRLRENGFRPDVIHAHVYGAGVPAALVAGRSGIPFLLTEQFTGSPVER